MEDLKKTLVKIAENHAIAAIDDVYALAEVYVKSTENIYDDMALNFLKDLKQKLVDFADKIDGEDNH